MRDCCRWLTLLLLLDDSPLLLKCGPIVGRNTDDNQRAESLLQKGISQPDFSMVPLRLSNQTQAHHHETNHPRNAGLDL